jgi:hypothetical protein
MANTFITPSIVGREALMILENNLVAAELFHRGHTDEFTGAKVGDTISVKAPASFTAQEFTSTTTTQNATQTSVSLQLEKHYDVTFGVTAKELTLSLEAFNADLLTPAVVALAQGIDAYVLGKVNQVPNFVGTAGDPPDALADIVAVEKKLNDLKVPMQGRFAIVDTQAKADMLSVAAVIQAEQRGDGGQALRDASMGRVMGIDWHMDQNITTQGDGSASTGWLINLVAGYAAGATSLVIDTGTNDPEVGDVFTVAGDTDQQVVTAYAANTITCSPGLGAAVVDNAAITIVAQHQMNVAGHGNGMTIAIVPLQLPMGNDKAEYVGDRNLGIRVVFDYDSSTKTDTISLDVLVGAKVQQEALLTRILG